MDHSIPLPARLFYYPKRGYYRYYPNPDLKRLKSLIFEVVSGNPLFLTIRLSLMFLVVESITFDSTNQQKLWQPQKNNRENWHHTW